MDEYEDEVKNQVHLHNQRVLLFSFNWTEMELDEQHSHSQWYGNTVPYCSCVFISKISIQKLLVYFILQRKMQQKLNIKYKAKTSRVIGLQHLSSTLKRISHIVVDGSSSVEKSINDYVKIERRHKDWFSEYGFMAQREIDWNRLE